MTLRAPGDVTPTTRESVWYPTIGSTDGARPTSNHIVQGPKLDNDSNSSWFDRLTVGGSYCGVVFCVEASIRGDGQISAGGGLGLAVTTPALAVGVTDPQE